MSIVSDFGRVKELIKSKGLLVFDFDGVLADSIEIKTNAFAALYESHGTEVVKKVIEHHRNNGGMSRFEKFKYYHKEFLNIYLDDVQVTALSNEFSNLIVDKVVVAPEISGATVFLKKFCIGERLCVINSATPVSEIIKIVDARSLSCFFQCVYGSPNTKKENLLKIKNLFGIDTNDGVFFGDSESDFSAAQSMGMDFIGVGENIKRFLENIQGKWLVIDDFSGFVNGA